ncbi:MAG: class I SAM-dependent methyltransferase, partial [Lachnospiraceae bacterium]|nr:class I SAM-dependent methyltransferase [Lachnospiraceae bacterium]
MNGTGTDTFIEWMSAAAPGSLDQLEKRAREEGVPVIRKSAQSLLGFFCTLLKPDRILEIGSGVGFSALLMRNFAGCRILGIELDGERAAEAGRNISEAGFSDDIEIRCADAADVLKELAQEEGENGAERFDLVFLDGPKGQYQ